MNLWIEIPHGEFFVCIDDPAAWRAVKIGFALRGLWWEEYDPKPVPQPEPLSLADFLMVASSCPCPEHMDELARDMGYP